MTLNFDKSYNVAVILLNFNIDTDILNLKRKKKSETHVLGLGNVRKMRF